MIRIPRLRVVDGLVRKFLVRRLLRFFRRNGESPLVLYIFHPKYFEYVEEAKPDFVVYHAYDLHGHAPGWNEELERDERSLLSRADLVVASSDQIAIALKVKVQRDVKVLPNGANVKAFGDAVGPGGRVPADLARIPRPRIGWVGSLHPQVDFGLIKELADLRPDWNFVFVGQIIAQPDVRAENERAECRMRQNIHFLGAKTIDDVPSYVANMDVNIMIYRMTDEAWIKAGYPLKLHEYLAVGHPVVSSDLPSVRPFKDVVRITEGLHGWAASIDDALNGRGMGTAESRMSVAAQNGWDARVDMLETWLNELVSTSDEQDQ